MTKKNFDKEFELSMLYTTRRYGIVGYACCSQGSLQMQTLASFLGIGGLGLWADGIRFPDTAKVGRLCSNTSSLATPTISWVASGQLILALKNSARSLRLAVRTKFLTPLFSAHCGSTREHKTVCAWVIFTGPSPVNFLFSPRGRRAYLAVVSGTPH